MTSLKPCPFCGGEAELTRYINTYAVQCPECRAIPFEYGDESLAIAAWNTRAERTCNMELVGRNSYVCSACGSLVHWQHVDRPNYCQSCGAKVIGG